MGKAIVDTKIGDNTVFAADKFFDALALANAGAITSAEFLFAQTLGMAEIQIRANGAVATGAGETLVISVTAASASGGTFAEVASFTVPASTSFVDGEVIAAYVAPADLEDCFTIVSVTSDFDALAFDVDGVVTMV